MTAPSSFKGYCVLLGLGKPRNRCACAAVLVGAAALALKMPRCAFCPDTGSPLPFNWGGEEDAAQETTRFPWWAVPVAAGIVVYLA